MVQSNSMTS